MAIMLHVAQSVGIRTLSLDFTPPFPVQGVRGAVERIATGMRLPSASLRTEVLQDSPTDDKLAEKFASWLTGESAALVDRWWLGFDGLGLPEAQSVRDLLVPRLLLEASQGNLGGIQLVLLGYNARSIQKARRVARHEDARGLEPADFRTFLKNVAMARGTALTDPELEQVLGEVLAACALPYDHSSM